MHEFTKVMKAFSDPNRVKIVKMLQCRELCVCEIKSALDLAQSTVSKHLSVLEGAGLILSRKEGLWVYYRLSGGDRSPYAAVLAGCLRHWLEEDAEVLETRRRLTGVDRDALCGI